MREKVERRIQDFENKRDSALSSMDIIAAGHYSRQISELKEVLSQHADDSSQRISTDTERIK